MINPIWSDISDIKFDSNLQLDNTTDNSVDDILLLQLKKRNSLSLLEWMFEVKKVTKEENETIKNMLTSSDLDNFYLAVEIIKNKK
jgi:hypothetical protein